MTFDLWIEGLCGISNYEYSKYTTQFVYSTMFMCNTSAMTYAGYSWLIECKNY